MTEPDDQLGKSDQSGRSDRSDQSDPEPRHHRSLTGFYVVVCAVIVLGLFGFWFWRTWTVWWFDADEAQGRQAAAAARLGLPVEQSLDLGGGVKLELVLVPAGRFKMGSPAKEKDREADEKQHWVMVTRPFYLGKYEVTQEQWEKVMGERRGGFETRPYNPKNPVETVSWDDCQEFLKKANRLGKGQFRLPTEAEWEWACRAGTRTRFCSGDADESLVDYAWFDANSGNTTHPVGEKKPNAWDLFDMHGNVWEWCSDWYGEYAGGRMPVQDPDGPATGSFRVLRGGSWYYFPRYCRSAGRVRVVPDARYVVIGLRVLVVPAGP